MTDGVAGASSMVRPNAASLSRARFDLACPPRSVCCDHGKDHTACLDCVTRLAQAGLDGIGLCLVLLDSPPAFSSKVISLAGTISLVAPGCNGDGGGGDGGGRDGGGELGGGGKGGGGDGNVATAVAGAASSAAAAMEAAATE
eukprot:scaffold58211_cov33-Phaeocystis_antarctica.AAC.1